MSNASPHDPGSTGEAIQSSTEGPRRSRRLSDQYSRGGSTQPASEGSQGAIRGGHQSPRRGRPRSTPSRGSLHAVSASTPSQRHNAPFYGVFDAPGSSQYIAGEGCIANQHAFGHEQASAGQRGHIGSESSRPSVGATPDPAAPQTSSGNLARQATMALNIMQTMTNKERFRQITLQSLRLATALSPRGILTINPVAASTEQRHEVAFLLEHIKDHAVLTQYTELMDALVDSVPSNRPRELRTVEEVWRFVLQITLDASNQHPMKRNCAEILQ